jgi:hypothetical protein
MLWVRLGDEKALPGPNLGATTANLIFNEFILTPKVGFRIVNQEKLKIDALTGFRYWHVGQNLQFSPSILKPDYFRLSELGGPVSRWTN